MLKAKKKKITWNIWNQQIELWRCALRPPLNPKNNLIKPQPWPSALVQNHHLPSPCLSPDGPTLSLRISSGKFLMPQARCWQEFMNITDETDYDESEQDRQTRNLRWVGTCWKALFWILMADEWLPSISLHLLCQFMSSLLFGMLQTNPVACSGDHIDLVSSHSGVPRFPSDHQLSLD